MKGITIETNLLKLLGSVWIILVRVRMIFLSELIVCLLYLLLTGIPDQGAYLLKTDPFTRTPHFETPNVE